MSKHSAQSGFSLVELMVTLAVAATVVRLAIPSFSEMISSNRLTASANQLISALSFTRSEAVKRGVSVIMKRKDQTVSFQWELGWDVFVDADGDQSFNPDIANQCLPGEDCLLRSYDALPSGYTLRTGNNAKDLITYSGNGFTQGVYNDTFTLCDGSHQDDHSRRIAINNMGRVRILTDTPPAGICP